MDRIFGYEIRDADNKIVASVEGYTARESVEPIADKKRDEIRRRGWNMSVYVTERKPTA